MGMSAGAILMTPNIESAGFPSFDRDENEERITNLKALNLVPFQFFPHYVNSRRYDRVFLSRSRRSSHPLYGCRGDSGIIVDGGKLSFVGRCYGFYRGCKIPLFC